MVINGKTVPNKEVLEASRRLKAMSHPLRFRILCELCERGEMSVRNIVAAVGTSQSNISQHLATLRRKEFLVSRKEANQVLYSIRDRRLLMLLHQAHESLCGAAR